MAEQVRIDLIAEDKASKPIDQVAAKVADLEAADPKVTVTADATKAQRSVSDVLADVKKLDSQDATIVLELRAASVESELTDILQTVAKVDADKATIDVELERAGELRADLDQLQTAIKDLNATPVEIDTTRAADGFKKLEKEGQSASSSVSSMANSVGNNASEMGAALGLDGPLGQSIGEFGEYITEAALEGEGFGSVLGNFAKFAGPIAILSTVIGTISNVLARSKAEAEASTARIKQFGAALDGAAGGADALADSFKENSQMLTRFDAEAQGFGDSIVEGLANIGRDIPIVNSALGDAGQNISDLIPIMKAAGITSKEFAEAVASGGLLFGGEWTQKLLDANAAGKITDDQLAALSDSIHKFGAEATKAKDLNEFFNGSLEDQAKAASDAAGEAAQLAVDTNRAGRAATDAARAWDDLSGSLNIQQQVADLGTSFDDMKAKAQDAWEKTRKGADDAKAAQDDYAQSVRDAKSHVVDLGKQIGVSIPDVKKMLLQIDDGQIDDVQRKLDIMARNRTMELSIISKGGPGYGTQTGGISGPRAVLPAPPVAAPVTNVSITMPRGLRAVDVMREADRYARRNGSAHARRR